MDNQVFFVSRKATGRVVGQDVPQGRLEQYLSVLPSGVYSVEFANGKEFAVATVKFGKVQLRQVGLPVMFESAAPVVSSVPARVYGSMREFFAD